MFTRSAVSRFLFGIAIAFLSCGSPALVGKASAQGAAAPLQVQPQTEVPIPLPSTAEDIDYDGGDGKLEFSSSSSVRSLAEFFRSQLKSLGWKEQPTVINRTNMAVLNLEKGDKSLTVTIMQMGDTANVSINGEGLVTAAGKAKQDQQANTTPPDKDDMEVEETNGFPVPRRRTSTAVESTPFRKEFNVTAPIGLPFMIEFYRRELPNKKWTEDTSKTDIAPDKATLVFTSATEGSATLRLARKDGETTIKFGTRDTAEATKQGVVAKPGQSKILLGNITQQAATVTINKQTYNIAAGVGSKAPNGPTIDLPPGKYPFSIKLGTRTMKGDEISVGADETWGIVVGPGGGLALQVY